MKAKRRSFLKKALGAGALVATSSVVAKEQTKQQISDGVVVGKSNKKEILYKLTPAWEEYYKVAY